MSADTVPSGCLTPGVGSVFFPAWDGLENERGEGRQGQALCPLPQLGRSTGNLRRSPAGGLTTLPRHLHAQTWRPSTITHCYTLAFFSICSPAHTHTNSMDIRVRKTYMLHIISAYQHLLSVGRVWVFLIPLCSASWCVDASIYNVFTCETSCSLPRTYVCVVRMWASNKKCKRKIVYSLKGASVLFN